MKLSISIVTYHTSIIDLEKAVESIRKCTLPYILAIVDNSSSDEIAAFCYKNNIEYISPGCNLGFGAAHNLVLKKQLGKTDYHLVLNPDAYFEKNCIEEVIAYMNQHPDVGLCVPQVRYPKGEIQHLCKLVPSPTDLIGRRFIPDAFSSGQSRLKYEMRQFDYHQNMEVPVLSGCCMFLRDAALAKCGIFDERFFLYLEDVDLSRRIYRHFRNIHFAKSVVYHHYQKSSYSNPHSTRLHIKSAIKYFNKWGWIFDRERQEMNRKAQKANRRKQHE